MHQTKYRGIITEAGSLTYSPWEPASRLVKPLKKSVNPFGGDLCFGWLGSPRLSNGCQAVNTSLTAATSSSPERPEAARVILPAPWASLTGYK